jgi:predicted enzyme related to lactoylglutathione lyase
MIKPLTFYIMGESTEDFISKSQKQCAKVLINKKEISECFYTTLQDKQQNAFGLWQSKKLVSKSIV